MRKYKYNLNMVLDRMQLHSIKMKENESFKKYPQRWQELFAQVNPPLYQKEMKGIFMDTLKDPYIYRLLTRGASGFVDLVAIGDNIEKGLKSGKILSNVGTPSAQKTFFWKLPEKEGG